MVVVDTTVVVIVAGTEVDDGVADPIFEVDVAATGPDACPLDPLQAVATTTTSAIAVR